MIITKENRRKIYTYLFQEGVMVAKKDFNAPKHQDIDVPNLQVIKALQSMNSRGLVQTRFSWQYFYYYLTNDGIEYLRAYLHLPAEVVPKTFVKAANKAPRSGARPEGDRPYRSRPEGGDREGGYRRADKKEGASGDFKPEFRAGFGRGQQQE